MKVDSIDFYSYLIPLNKLWQGKCPRRERGVNKMIYNPDAMGVMTQVYKSGSHPYEPSSLQIDTTFHNLEYTTKFYCIGLY